MPSGTAKRTQSRRNLNAHLSQCQETLNFTCHLAKNPKPGTHPTQALTSALSNVTT